MSAMHPHVPSLSHPTVDGWSINLPNPSTALRTIIEDARRGEAFTVFTLNLDHLVKLRESTAFRAAYLQATYVTADGEPIARLARRKYSPIIRTTGADLVVPLAIECAKARIPVFLFGTSPTILTIASQRLVEAAGRTFDIVGTLSPGLDFNPESKTADAAIERIKSSGARICFVALGAPKQEIFAARAITAGVRCGFICIGAGLDFIAGEQIRAPTIFQKLGLEWLWRLALNPRRFGKRYTQCAALLIRLIFLPRLPDGKKTAHHSAPP